MTEISQLASLLLNTGLQRRDNPLYQFLSRLLMSLNDVDKNLQAQIDAASSTPTTINQTVQNLMLNDSVEEIDPKPALINNNLTNIFNQFMLNNEENNDYSIFITPVNQFNQINQPGISMLMETDYPDVPITIPGPKGADGISSQTFVVLSLNDQSDNEPFLISVPPSLLGAGVINRLAKWVTAFSLGTSLVSDDGTSVAVNSALEVTGIATLDSDISVLGKVIFLGEATPTIPYDGTKTNDANPSTAAVIRYTASSGATFAAITGFTGGTQGRVLYIINGDASKSLFLDPEDAGSSASNRIEGVGGTQIEIKAGRSIMLVYDGVGARWSPLHLNG
jgi:hypothetical protein